MLSILVEAEPTACLAIGSVRCDTTIIAIQRCLYNYKHNDDAVTGAPSAPGSTFAAVGRTASRAQTAVRALLVSSLCRRTEHAAPFALHTRCSVPPQLVSGMSGRPFARRHGSTTQKANFSRINIETRQSKGATIIEFDAHVTV